VADTMDQNNIQVLNVSTIRSMAETLTVRLSDGTVNPTA
jgi:hypothetical protein